MGRGVIIFWCMRAASSILGVGGSSDLPGGRHGDPLTHSFFAGNRRLTELGSLWLPPGIILFWCWRAALSFSGVGASSNLPGCRHRDLCMNCFFTGNRRPTDLPGCLEGYLHITLVFPMDDKRPIELEPRQGDPHITLFPLRAIKDRRSSDLPGCRQGDPHINHRQSAFLFWCCLLVELILYCSMNL